MKKTSIEISDDMLALDDLLADGDIDWDDPQVQAIICEFATENEEAFTTKVDNSAALISEWLNRAAMRKSEAKRMNALAQTDENNAKNLKEHLKYILQKIGRSKVETPRFRVSVARNGGLAPLFVRARVDELPVELTRTEIMVDNDAIRKKLEAGEHVYGCELGERGTSLRIK